MKTTDKSFYVILVFLGVAMTACYPCVRGSGRVVEEKRMVATYRSIDLDVPATLYVTQEKLAPVTIRTDDNIATRISIEVSGDTLRIKPSASACCFDPSELTITASADTIENLRVSGSGDIVIRGGVRGRKIALEIHGSGSIASDAPIQVQSAKADIEGSGEISAAIQVVELSSSIHGSGEFVWSGEANEHQIVIEGSGEIEASKFQTQNTSVTIEGSGECSVAASKSLEVTIDGSGEVKFRGNPQMTQNIDGSGSVESL